MSSLTERKKAEPFAICIGRQLASGGRAVGRLLATRLGATYYDREILDIAARESGLSREAFERNDERKGFFSMAVRSMSTIISMSGQLPARDGGIKLFELQAEAIRNAAAENNCIFIGRAADYVLREHPCRLSVFVSADANDRIATLVRDKGINEHEAYRLMEKTDAKRASFYNFYSGKTWGHATSYDLCINISRIGVQGAADIIDTALQAMLARECRGGQR